MVFNKVEKFLWHQFIRLSNVQSTFEEMHRFLHSCIQIIRILHSPHLVGKCFMIYVTYMIYLSCLLPFYSPKYLWFWIYPVYAPHSSIAHSRNFFSFGKFKNFLPFVIPYAHTAWIVISVLAILSHKNVKCVCLNFDELAVITDLTFVGQNCVSKFK